MPLHELANDGTVGAGAGDVAVIVGPATEYGAFARCLRSLLEHTATTVPIVVLADAATEPAVSRWLRELDEGGELQHDVHWLQAHASRTVGRAWTAAASAVTPADIVVLHADCVVAQGWLGGLRSAVTSAGNLASATALSNHAGFASVPHRNLPWALLSPELTVDEAARRVRSASLRIAPRAPTALAHCAWVTRAALDLVGAFDETLKAAEDALADFSQACVAHGLQHVLADDVLVMHRGGAADGGDGTLGARHPELETLVLETSHDRFSALARALSAASRGLAGVSVTIDGRCLTPGLDGTRIHTLELIGALARTGGARLRVVLPDDLGSEARQALAKVDDLTLIAESEVGEGIARTDIVHRAWQVFDGEDLGFLDRLGERIVVTNQDLIAYRNPHAFATHDDWLRYRRLTSEAMAVASAVLFFSRDAADDALADDLVEPERAHVVPIGVDHQLVGDPREVAPPPDAEPLQRRPFLLCLGNRFRHKNLVFALRVLERLRADHDWDGGLVIAGAETVHGTSSGDEAAFLGLRSDLSAHVTELGAVPEAQKRWLLEHAAAVLYPSTYEGFGLIPFEAAQVGTPCLFAHVSSLREMLPAAAATIVPWNPARTADAAAAVLREPARAQELVDLVAAAGAGLTWDATARRVLDTYAAAAASRAPAMASVAASVARVEHDYWKLRGDLGRIGMALVGEDDRLLDDESQRGLARIASRRRLRAPLRAALKAVAKLPPNP